MEYVASTLETVSSFLPEDLDITDILYTASTYLPAEIDFFSAMKFLFFFSVMSLVMGILARFVMGKRSSLNHAISSAMGILFVYVATIGIYTFRPWKLDVFLSPLPFVTLFEDFIVLSPIIDISLSLFCTQMLSLIILSFLVNILDTFIPKGNSILSWYIYRFITVALAMVLHLIVHWACNIYLPTGLVTYAPIALLGVLLSMLLLGVLNIILGIALTIMNPILGGIYTFFFSNIIGKQITKAVFSSVLICALFLLIEKMGYIVIYLSSSAIITCIPLILVLLILWHLLGHVL